MSTSLRSPGSSTLGPVTHAALRIGAGLLFMQHGVQKLFGFFGGFGPERRGGSVDVAVRAGRCARDLRRAADRARPAHPAGGAAAGDRDARGLLPVPLPAGGYPIENRGELPLLFMLVWLFFAGNGAGPTSLDAARALTQPQRRIPNPIRASPRRSALAHPTRSSTGGRRSAISASRSTVDRPPT